jgi:deoxycytidylate deaminase
MLKGTDLSELYSLRKDFTIIGLTGRNGSGLNRVAELMSTPFDEKNFQDPNQFDLGLNSYKKYKIIYNFAKENFVPYTYLRYKDFITLYILKFSFGEFQKFLKSPSLQKFFSDYRIEIDSDFSAELKIINKLRLDFEKYHLLYSQLGQEDGIRSSVKKAKLFCAFYLSENFKDFSNSFHKALQVNSYAKHNLALELITNNIRKSGNPYNGDLKDQMHVFSLAELINSTVKAIRKKNDKQPTKIVIDSFRNPFEVMFFKQRYSAFYLVAINRDDKIREKVLEHFYKSEYYGVIRELLLDEYVGGKGTGFYRQYVRDCIEKADIHITFRSVDESIRLNKNRNDGTSPFFTWQMQTLKYLSLIEHPGLITPSPEERCMQLAYTAKYNSGCISRQVGAAITDIDYSVKAIGWNNTPEGQTPCLMRNAEVLLSASEDYIKAELRKEKNNESKDLEKRTALNEELSSFTPYEKTDKTFKQVLHDNYQNALSINKPLLKGRNVCFCFKSLQNSCSEGKNQVHTRSLHAEESAFLQIAKYGGTSIKNGKLFTTASPCELCAKKAYQLGIKVIYYVDPYPGISSEQILSVGTNKPQVRLFNGAIGNAYFWLYEPLMPYKDEMTLLLGLKIQDKVKQLEESVKLKELRIKKLEMQLARKSRKSIVRVNK